MTSKVPEKYRRALDHMASGGLLCVYVLNPHKIFGPPAPPEGSGAVCYDGLPLRISRRCVRLLRRLGTRWDPQALAEVMTDEGRAKARALLQGRDVIYVASAAL